MFQFRELIQQELQELDQEKHKEEDLVHEQEELKALKVVEVLQEEENPQLQADLDQANKKIQIKKPAFRRVFYLLLVSQIIIKSFH
jgi:hypothetical protein